MPIHEGSMWNEEVTNKILSMFDNIEKAIKDFEQLPEQVQGEIVDIKCKDFNKSLIYLMESCSNLGERIQENFGIK